MHYVVRHQPDVALGISAFQQCEQFSPVAREGFATFGEIYRQGREEGVAGSGYEGVAYQFAAILCVVAEGEIGVVGLAYVCLALAMKCSASLLSLRRISCRMGSPPLGSVKSARKSASG